MMTSSVKGNHHHGGENDAVSSVVVVAGEGQNSHLNRVGKSSLPFLTFYIYFFN